MGSFQEFFDMMPLTIDGLCDFLPTFLLFYLTQENSFLRRYGFVFIWLIHTWYILLLLALK